MRVMRVGSVTTDSDNDNVKSCEVCKVGWEWVAAVKGGWLLHLRLVGAVAHFDVTFKSGPNE